MRHLLLPLFLLSALACWGQTAADPQTITIESPPLKLPLLASLLTLPQRQPADDSLLQLAYRRNRVRTVTLLQAREQNGFDTIDYTELNRQGQLVFYRPAFGQPYRQRYNRHQQLVEKTVYPALGFEQFMQATYDPATQLTTTRLGPSLQQLATLQVVRRRRLGDTFELEGFMHPNPLLPAAAPHRLATRYFRVGGDTTRLDVLGYDAAGKVLAFESYYQLGSYQRRAEEGQVLFGNDTTSAAAQWLASHHTHGHYAPTARQTFDARGYLVRRLFIPLPTAAREQSVTQKNPFLGSGMTISSLADTTSARYVRTPQGQLLREEYWLPGRNPLASNKKSRQLTFTEYTYAPNGLRRTKAGNLAARYVYRYPYY